MSFRKEDFIDCVGSVNVLLDDRVVLQGQIIKERHNDDPINVNVEVESENEFITLELTCDALIIRDNAELKEISPTLFGEGVRVRINIAEISAIGPSNGCPSDEEEDNKS
jgi:thiamine biosynthesis protein ThiC